MRLHIMNFGVLSTLANLLTDSPQPCMLQPAPTRGKSEKGLGLATIKVLHTRGKAHPTQRVPVLSLFGALLSAIRLDGQ